MFAAPDGIANMASKPKARRLPQDDEAAKTTLIGRLG